MGNYLSRYTNKNKNNYDVDLTPPTPYSTPIITAIPGKSDINPIDMSILNDIVKKT